MGPHAASPELALGQFVAGLSWETLHQQVQDKACACLLYGLSVGLATLGHPLPGALRHAHGSGVPWSPGRASLGCQSFTAQCLLDGSQIPVQEAAFHNAILLHARIQEDAHPAGHVGVVVLPAAMAVAQGVGASGKDLLCAVVAGYEVALRLARDHVLDSTRRGFRSTSLYGVFGAAAAAARLTGADARGVQRALSLAANLAAGLRGFVEAGSDEYVLHAAFASQNGIAAALLAKAQIEIATEFLDTRAGFYRATGEGGSDYSGRVGHDLGRDYEFLRVTYKPYPTCQFNRNVIRGVLALRQQAAEGRLRGLDIHMRPFEAEFVGIAARGPFSAYAQTFMSAPFAAATAWLRGTVTFEDLQRFDAEDVQTLATQVNVISDADRPAYHPQIIAGFEDGKRVQWRSEDSADEYFLDWQAAVCMAGRLEQEWPAGSAACQQLIEVVESLEQSGSLEELGAALEAAAGRS